MCLRVENDIRQREDVVTAEKQVEVLQSLGLGGEYC